MVDLVKGDGAGAGVVPYAVKSLVYSHMLRRALTRPCSVGCA